MADINPTVSIITLSVNSFNDSVKRQRLSEGGKKPRFDYMPSTGGILYTERYKSIES